MTLVTIEDSAIHVLSDFEAAFDKVDHSNLDDVVMCSEEYIQKLL